MKVIRLQAQNVKRLKAVDITPENNVVVISGKNGQGKTSVLDSIWFGLGGAEAVKDTPEPIREGEKSAFVKMDLGDIAVTRVWTANDRSTLRVENKQGAVFKSPQTMLDNLLGSLSFDPLRFSRMKGQEQRSTLRGFAQMDTDPDEIDRQKESYYSQRTEINRQAKVLAGKLAGKSKPEVCAIREEISSVSVIEKINTAREIQRSNDAKREELGDLNKDVGILQRGIEAERTNSEEELSLIDQRAADIAEEIRLLQDKLGALAVKRDNLLKSMNTRKKERKKEMESLKKKVDSLAAEVDKLIDPDMEGLTQELDGLERTNREIRETNDYWEKLQEKESLEAKSQELTDTIAGLEKEKEDAFRRAKFPIDGLSYDDSGVRYQGIPFSQCSDSEKLKVSMAMAMALNPQIRIIRITDGSLLDEENFKVIQEMTKGKDGEEEYQIWIEVVDSTGTLGIYIEDGEVK